MRILITGGSGFVGINWVRSLAARDGVRVVAADVQPWGAAGDRFLAPVRHRLNYAPLDVRDGEAVVDLVQREAITHIVHAAAITASDQQERARAAEIVGVNLGGAMAVLNAALAIPNVERVLLMSSSGVYGAPRRRRTRRQAETDRLDLSNLYTITKYSAELLAARYARLAGRPMMCVRLGSVYGPLERASASRPRTSQPHQLSAALRRGQAVKVAGNSVKRDWTYVEDAASGVWALLTAHRLRHSVYNLGSVQSISFQEVVDAFVAHGLHATWVDDPGQADVAMHPDQERLPMDMHRLAADAGFVPAVDFATGVARMLQVRDWEE